MSIVMPHPMLPTAGTSTPIADYGPLPDCNGSALVDRAGSIRLAVHAPLRQRRDLRANAGPRCGPLVDLGFDAPHELLEGVAGEVELKEAGGWTPTTPSALAKPTGSPPGSCNA